MTTTTHRATVLDDGALTPACGAYSFALRRRPEPVTCPECQAIDDERREREDGYEAGASSHDGDECPAAADTPFARGWLEGHQAARQLATAAADQAEDELAAALGLADYEPVFEPDTHPRWALDRVERGLGL